jgi:hypothetical protein
LFPNYSTLLLPLNWAPSFSLGLIIGNYKFTALKQGNLKILITALSFFSSIYLAINIYSRNIDVYYFEPTSLAFSYSFSLFLFLFFTSFDLSKLNIKIPFYQIYLLHLPIAGLVNILLKSGFYIFFKPALVFLFTLFSVRLLTFIINKLNLKLLKLLIGINS